MVTFQFGNSPNTSAVWGLPQKQATGLSSTTAQPEQVATHSLKVIAAQCSNNSESQQQIPTSVEITMQDATVILFALASQLPSQGKTTNLPERANLMTPEAPPIIDLNNSAAGLSKPTQSLPENTTPLAHSVLQSSQSNISS